MTAAQAPDAPPGADQRRHLRRWRRRSRLIGLLRKLLPAAVAALLLSLVGQVLWTTTAAKSDPVEEAPVAIRMLNPRFFGRDEQGRSFMIAAREATRDERDLTRVILDHPVVGLATDTPAPSRVSARSGLYTEGDRMLRLEGEVRIEDAGGYRFATEEAIVDTRAGTIIGEAAMVTEGPVGQVNSDSYGVYEKGDRVIFKGGVRARITPE